MEHYTIRGRLSYTSKKPEIRDKVRGGETFIITVHPDGRRSLRAHCGIDENSPRVLRDCILNLDKDWMTREAFIQITVDEAFIGSAWYRFTETLAECEGYTAAEGRISHRFVLDERPGYLVTHPIQADAWQLSRYDLSKGPGQQQVRNTFTCTPHHRGAEGPILKKNKVGNTLVLVGPERVTVAAGTFDALHFRIGATTDDAYMGSDVHPPYHLWTTADGDYVLLKASVTGYMQTHYELVEYERKAGFF